jgi:hypothetical protein
MKLYLILLFLIAKVKIKYTKYCILNNKNNTTSLKTFSGYGLKMFLYIVLISVQVFFAIYWTAGKKNGINIDLLIIRSMK